MDIEGGQSRLAASRRMGDASEASVIQAVDGLEYVPDTEPCVRCSRTIAIGDRYCRECGVEQPLSERLQGRWSR
jgi:hypothetical protein